MISEKQQNTVKVISRLLIIISLAYILILGILLSINYFQLRLHPLADNESLTTILRQIDRDPGNEELLDAYRELHMLNRRVYFSLRFQFLTGRYFLLGGIVILFLAVQVPAYFLPKDFPGKDHRKIRKTEYISGILLPLWIFAVLFGTAGFITTFIQGTEGGRGKALDYPSLKDDRRGNWTVFRGDAGHPLQQDIHLPLEWDGIEGTNILWKLPLDNEGFSSPVIWKNTVYLTAADEESAGLLAVDADSGELIWRIELINLQELQNKPDVTGDTGYAASTPAVDSRGVYAVFATGDLFCVNHRGKLLWERSLGTPDNPYGHSSSLLCYDSLLYIQYDHRSEAVLYCIDTATGEDEWSRDRSGDHVSSWSSPILAYPPHSSEKDTGTEVSVNQEIPLLITNGNPWVTAYDPLTGREVWKLDCLDGEVAPSAAYGEGTVFITNQFAAATAIDFGSGEALWRNNEIPLPDVSSPLWTPAGVFIATSWGYVTLLDPVSGEPFWIEEQGTGAYSSPIFSGGMIYTFSRDGICSIIEASRTYSVIGVNELGESVDATPAVTGSSLIVRGRENLYRIGGTE